MSTAPAPVAEESRSSHGRLGPGSARVSHARYVGWTYKYKVRYTRQLYSRDMFKMCAKSSPHRQRIHRKRGPERGSSSRSTLNAEKSEWASLARRSSQTHLRLDVVGQHRVPWMYQDKAMSNHNMLRVHPPGVKIMNKKRLGLRLPKFLRNAVEM